MNKEAAQDPPRPARAEWRLRLGRWIDQGWPHHVIVALIVANAITIGVETSNALSPGVEALLLTFERFVLTVFVIEIALKLLAHGPRFFKSGWNNLDFLVVAVALVPAAGPLAILRTLRILRVLRLLSSVPRLRQLTESLISAIPSIGWISFMLGLVFYVFAVIGTELFGEVFPQYFGNIAVSMFTLFQVMTLESWSMGIARPVMGEFPLAWMFFVPFILISAFTILNLFIGIIVNTMQALHWEEEDQKREEIERRAHAERDEMMVLIRSIAGKLEELEKKRS